VDVVLQVADASQTVNVIENTAEVRTTDTQIGQTIESKQLVDIPLNGQSYKDLLAVQAGISPVTTSGAGNTSSRGGFGTVPAAGRGRMEADFELYNIFNNINPAAFQPARFDYGQATAYAGDTKQLEQGLIQLGARYTF
jgi:hypothetical protein